MDGVGEDVGDLDAEDFPSLGRNGIYSSRGGEVARRDEAQAGGQSHHGFDHGAKATGDNVDFLP